MVAPLFAGIPAADGGEREKRARLRRSSSLRHPLVGFPCRSARFVDSLVKAKRAGKKNNGIEASPLARRRDHAPVGCRARVPRASGLTSIRPNHFFVTTVPLSQRIDEAGGATAGSPRGGGGV